MLALVLATLTHNNTALALLAAEGRGKSFYGEPSSWWQTEEVRLMSELGATRSALCSYEPVQKWTKQNRDKPGSMGIMTNFCVQCPELHEGWPQLSEASLSSNVGPLPVMCKCGCKHTSLITARPLATAVEPSICAHLLQSLPRLPEERGSLNMSSLRVNSAGHFSPLSNPDSLGIFFLRQQPWLQAWWRACQESEGSNSSKANQVVEAVPEQVSKREEEGGREEKVRVAGGSVLVHCDTVNRKSQRTEGPARVHGTGMRRARSELESAQEARESGGTLTAQPGKRRYPLSGNFAENSQIFEIWSNSSA